MTKKVNLKEKFLNFYKGKQHAIIPSASIIPNDNSTLFVTAGIQPLVPYFLGEKYPVGDRIANCQKCFRANDLDDIGDLTHHTFFEMLGNWSLGSPSLPGYSKKDTLTWALEFYTKVLNVPLEKIAVTAFAGNKLVPLDQESIDVWRSLGIPNERIARLPAEDNWWPSMNQTGPCGSCSEMFYWRDNTPPPEVYDPSDKRWVEIRNNVFIGYNHLPSGEFAKLPETFIDTGLGVERTTAILEGVNDNYQTSLWQPIIRKICELSNKTYSGENLKPIRIIADHLRASVVLAADGVVPSNTDRGYILRRLIRRTLRYAKQIGINISNDFDVQIAKEVVGELGQYYPELKNNFDQVVKVLTTEKEKFSRTLEKGLKEVEKYFGAMKKGEILSGEKLFTLFDTFGFPVEITEELAKEKGIKVDIDGFKQCYIKHQEKSRQGVEGKFKGGLSGESGENVKLHTATHLLQCALRIVLGKEVQQKGSNITPERLRFDFSFPRKLTNEELQKVELIVNKAIDSKIKVIKTEMTYKDAVDSGALGFFSDKYGETVTVYDIGGHREICEGPHVQNISELQGFKITNEEAVSSGVRRIKAEVGKDLKKNLNSVPHQ